MGCKSFSVLTRCVVCLILFCSTQAKAEFPALESAFGSDLSTFAAELQGKTVLVSLDESLKLNVHWRLAAAIETEIVAQLLGNNIDAVDDDADHRFAWLAQSQTKTVFSKAV